MAKLNSTTDLRRKAAIPRALRQDLSAVEARAADENAVTLDATRPIADIVADAVSLFEANS
ncbi:hypothetical protein [Mesorhizobium escarrei]|uniref:Uncharacterized protein n=1 Tax=Mesorhizobium escarrei TaxID=666018 RepID=A0ABM9DVH9_9HYPH|nr:hypothetical protein [Mesorhizobium escarrei]CAH2400701.1 hypothetical protein MES5069_270002 [Mesorhizobium escarrei]